MQLLRDAASHFPLLFAALAGRSGHGLTRRLAESLLSVAYPLGLLAQQPAGERAESRADRHSRGHVAGVMNAHMNPAQRHH